MLGRGIIQSTPHYETERKRVERQERERERERERETVSSRPLIHEPFPLLRSCIIGILTVVPLQKESLLIQASTWVVVKIMVPFWVLIIIRHLIFRVPQKGP